MACRAGSRRALGLFGVEVTDQLCGALEVGKQHGDLLALPFQGTAGGQDFLREIGGRVGEGCRGGRWGHGGSRGCGSVPNPDQYGTVLIGGEPLALDQFHLHIVQRLVIELELALEQTVRHATALAQKDNDLIHDRDKVHPVSSLSGAEPPCTCVRSS
jgi:hypothetical protein